VVSGSSLSAAVDAIEELEETARLYILLHGRPTHYLSAAQVADLKRRFP
jgi:ribulose-5-phosphate 4-epimerase/fuculose-1-phosphate aldolase